MSAVGSTPRPEPSPGDAAPSPWRRADLVRRVHLALDIVHRTLDAALAQDEPGATPAGASPPPDPMPPDVRPLLLAKVVAEAGILMRCVAGAGTPERPTADATSALARRLTPHARSRAVLARLCTEPAQAIEHAAAHVYLSDLGHRDESFDRFLHDILDADPPGGPERLPNHVLEHHWLAQVLSGAVDAEPVDAALLARTCVASPLDVLACSTADLYAFTHVVLYATDMGRRRVDWPRPVDEIEADAEAALAAALDADNFDIAAELLWTWPMLGLPWSAPANFAFDLLAAAQDEFGFLPGPQYDALVAATLAPARREAFVLRTSYHANIGMGILCAVTSRLGCAPSGHVAGMPADAHQVDGLLRLLPPSTRSPRWLDAQAALAPASRAALAPLVASIVLRRAAAAHDIERLRGGLQAAVTAAWADGPAVRQALALLRRVTALARL